MATQRNTIALAALIALALTAGLALAGTQLNTIGEDATIVGAGHQAQVTVVIACTEGERVRFHVTLTDGDGTTGTGQGAARCTGERETYSVTVAATGGDVFDPGPATAEAWAETRLGQHTHPRHAWEKAITLVE